MMLKFVVAFVILLIIYFPRKEGNFIELFGYSGAHVIFYYFIFVTIKIYSFHFEKLVLKNKVNSFIIYFECITTLFICFVLPILIVRFTGLYTLDISKFSILDYIFVLLVSYLLVDCDRSVRSLIVNHYDQIMKNNHSNGGVFFSEYPPKSSKDLYLGLLIIFTLSVVTIIGAISIKNS